MCDKVLRERTGLLIGTDSASNNKPVAVKLVSSDHIPSYLKQHFFFTVRREKT